MKRGGGGIALAVGKPGRCSMVFFQCLRLRTYRQLWLVLCLGNSHHHHHHHHHVLKEKVQSAVSTLYYLLAIMPDAFFSSSELRVSSLLLSLAQSRTTSLGRFTCGLLPSPPLPDVVKRKYKVHCCTAALLLCSTRFLCYTGNFYD